jgi:LysM repeat protein
MFAKISTAVLLTIVSAQAVMGTCTRSYIAQAGDYCDLISQKHNVSTYQLAAVNTGKINAGCTNLVPGQTYCLGVVASEDCSTTYIVQAGDTCSNIVAKNALNATILGLNNPQIDGTCSNIYPGEVLCTAKTVQVPPIPAGGVPITPSGQTATSPVTVDPQNPPAESSSSSDEEDCSDESTPSSTPAASVPWQTSPPASSSSNDDNEDDLPFCDEL